MLLYQHTATPRYALENLSNLVVACQEELARELGWSSYYYQIFGCSKFFTSKPISYRFYLRPTPDSTDTSSSSACVDAEQTVARCSPTSEQPWVAQELIPSQLAQELSSCIQQVLDRPLTSYSCQASAQLQSNQHSQLFTPLDVMQLPIQQHLLNHAYSWSQVSNHFHPHLPDLNLWQLLQTASATPAQDWQALARALPSWFNQLPRELKERFAQGSSLPPFTLRNIVAVYSQLRAHEWRFWGMEQQEARSTNATPRFTLPTSHHVSASSWSQAQLHQLFSSNLLAQSLLNPAFEYNLLESNSSMALHADFDYLEREVRTFAEFKPHLAKASYRNPRFLQILPRDSQLLLDPQFAASLEMLARDWLILDLTLDRLNLSWQAWLAQAQQLLHDESAHRDFIAQWFAQLRTTLQLYPELQASSGEARCLTPYCYGLARSTLHAYTLGELTYDEARAQATTTSKHAATALLRTPSATVGSTHEILGYEAILVLLNQQLRTNCQSLYLLAHRQVQLLSQVNFKQAFTPDYAFHTDLVHICDGDMLHHEDWLATLGNLSQVTFTHDLGASHIYYAKLEQHLPFLAPTYTTWQHYIKQDFHSARASQAYFKQLQAASDTLDPRDYELDYRSIDLDKLNAYASLDYQLHPHTKELVSLELPHEHLGLSLVSTTNEPTYPRTYLGNFDGSDLRRLCHLLTTQVHHTGQRQTTACLYSYAQLETCPAAASDSLPSQVAQHSDYELSCAVAAASLSSPAPSARLWFTPAQSKPARSRGCLSGYLLSPSICRLLRSTRADHALVHATAASNPDYRHCSALDLCNYFEVFDLHEAHLTHAYAFNQVNAYSWQARNAQLQSLHAPAQIEPRSYGNFSLDGKEIYIGLSTIRQFQVLTPLAHRLYKAEEQRERYLIQLHNEVSQRQAQANLHQLQTQAQELSLSRTHPDHLRAHLNQNLHDLSRVTSAELTSWRQSLEQLTQARNRLSNLYQACTHLELRKIFSQVLANPRLQEQDWITVIHGHYQVASNFLSQLQNWQQQAGVDLILLDTALNSHVMYCYFGQVGNTDTSYLSLNPHNLLFLGNYLRQFNGYDPYYASRAPQLHGAYLGLSLPSNWILGLASATHPAHLSAELIPAHMALYQFKLLQQEQLWTSLKLMSHAWLLGLLLAQLKIIQGQTLEGAELNYSKHHLNRCRHILRQELAQLNSWLKSCNAELVQQHQGWLTQLQSHLASQASLQQQWQDLQDELTQILGAHHDRDASQQIATSTGNLEHLLRCDISQLAHTASTPGYAQLLRCNFQVVDTLTNVEAVLAFQTPLATSLCQLLHNYLNLTTRHLEICNPLYRSFELTGYVTWLQQFTRRYASARACSTGCNFAQLVALSMHAWLALPSTNCSSNTQHGVALQAQFEQGAGTWSEQGRRCFRWRDTANTPHSCVREQCPDSSTPCLALDKEQPNLPLVPSSSARLRELFHARQGLACKLEHCSSPLQAQFTTSYHELYQHWAVEEQLAHNYHAALATIEASEHFKHMPAYLQPLQVQFSSARITVRIELLVPDETQRQLWLAGRNPQYCDYKYAICELFALTPLSIWRNKLLTGDVHPSNTHESPPARATRATSIPNEASPLVWHEFACLLDYLALNLNPNANVGHTGHVMPLSPNKLVDIMCQQRRIDAQIDLDNNYLALPAQFYLQRATYPTIVNRQSLLNIENFAIRKGLLRKLQAVWQQPDFRTNDLLAGLVALEAQATRVNNSQGITRGNYHVLLSRSPLLTRVSQTLGSMNIGISHATSNGYATSQSKPPQTYLEIRYLNLEVDKHKADYLEECFRPLQAEFAQYHIEAKLVRHTAVYGKQLSATEYNARFDEARFKQRYYRIPALGEIGCTLSYVEQMHAIAASEHIARHEYVLMIEDDLIFSPNFVAQVVRILQQLHAQSEQTTQLPPRWVNCFHYLFSETKPIDPRDTKQMANAHQHWLLTHYHMTDINILRPEYVTSTGSVCTLIRKDLAQCISRNLRELQIRPYWLADDFIAYPGMFTFDYAFTNPRLTVLHQEHGQQSNIGNERQRKRTYAIYLGQPLPCY